jgi:hypothetical protein
MKSNGAAPAHIRSEVRRKRGRDNVAAVVVKIRTEVAVRITCLYLSTCPRASFALTFTFTALKQVREEDGTSMLYYTSS